MATPSSSTSISGTSQLGKRTAQGEEDVEKRQKLSFGLGKNAAKNANTNPGLQIKLNTNSKTKTAKPLLKTSAVFNDESDDEPQEMPPEARMRMRNIGRDTPTSAGPNSFGKTKHGFCNAKKLFEKNLSSESDSVSDDKDKDVRRRKP